MFGILKSDSELPLNGKFSGMKTFYYALLPFLYACMAVAIPAIENGVGIFVFGPEEVVTDYAVLSDNSLKDLPHDITICSSLAAYAFNGAVSPFQLLYKSGQPWLSIYYNGAQQDSTHHRMQFKESQDREHSKMLSIIVPPKVNNHPQ